MKNEEFEERLSNWVRTLSTEERIPINIKALNFGLFESETGYIVHLYGCENYEEKDDVWSYSEDFVPKKRFLEFNQQYIKDMHWESFQSLVARALGKLLASGPAEEYNILSVKHVTTGFDDGDLIVVK